MLCFYQCGKEGTFTLKNGNACCSKTVSGCQTIKDKNSEASKLAHKEGRKTAAHFDGKRGSNLGKKFTSNEVMFSVNGTSPTGTLKARILQDKLLTYQCAVCNLENMWNGNPIVLELDHINGVSNDNRLENLRFLCPNCHSQTKTFRGRGNTGKLKVTDEEFMAAYAECKNIRQTLIRVGLVPKGGNYTRVSKLLERK